MLSLTEIFILWNEVNAYLLHILKFSARQDGVWCCIRRDGGQSHRIRRVDQIAEIQCALLCIKGEGKQIKDARRLKTPRGRPYDGAIREEDAGEIVIPLRAHHFVGTAT